MESRDQFQDARVLEVNFEDFVLNNKQEIINVSNFLNLDSAVKSTYNSQISEKNIGKYKKLLRGNEIETIKRELSKWINE